MQLKEIWVESRPCEACGGNNTEELWSYVYFAKTRHYTWKFAVKNVICLTCGFVYVSPAPTMQSLSEYYSDSFSRYMNQRLDYSIDKRIKFIKQNINGVKSFIELGSNARTDFYSQLCALFEEVKTIEPNNSVESDLSSLSQIAESSVDMVAHYFVLEHVPKVKEFLDDCFTVLKLGGIMICEVPLIDYYSTDISALMLYEHVNHFSFSSLRNIAAKAGFTLLHTSKELCSRSFGFVAAFVKAKKEGILPASSNSIKEITANKEYFNKGKQLALAYNHRADEIYNKIIQLNTNRENIIVWAANDNFLRLFNEDRPLLPNVIIVDSDLRKQNFLQSKVLLPDQASEEIQASNYIVICTKLHQRDILHSIKERYKKNFSPTHIFTFDY